MISNIYMICDAYESGFGHGLKRDGLDLSKTPHGDPDHGEAYQIGYEAGLERASPPIQIAEPVELPLKEAVLKLYSPPFRFVHGYIYDANGNMVADKAGDDEEPSGILRVRGWGRIGYMPEPEKLQDAVGEHIVTALNQYWAALKGPKP